MPATVEHSAAKRESRKSFVPESLPPTQAPSGIKLSDSDVPPESQFPTKELIFSRESNLLASHPVLDETHTAPFSPSPQAGPFLLGVGKLSESEPQSNAPSTVDAFSVDSQRESEQQLSVIPASTTHSDIIVPTKEDSSPSDSTKFGRGSWIVRAMGDSTKTKPTPMRSNSNLASMSTSKAAERDTSTRSSAPAITPPKEQRENFPSVKRKSDDIGEDGLLSRPSKVQKVQSEDVPRGNPVGLSGSHDISTFNGQPVAGPSRLSAAPIPMEAAPVPKCGLDKLREMLHGIQQPHRSNAPLRASSIHHTSSNVPQANTRTFSLSELVGDPDRSEANGSDDHDVSDDESAPSSDKETSLETGNDERVAAPDNRETDDVSSDVELENVQTEDDAVLINPVVSYTPPDSPPATRSNDSIISQAYSIPGAGSLMSTASESRNFRSTSSIKLVSANQPSNAPPSPSPPPPAASPPGSSMLSAALGTLSSMITVPAQFFSSAPKAPTSSPLRSQPTTNFLKHNPFAPSPEPGLASSVDLAINPFLVSPTRPTEDFHQSSQPRRSRTPPRTQVESQSTVFSQASGASWFAPSRTASHVSLNYETDITESQSAESQNVAVQHDTQAPFKTATALSEQDLALQQDMTTAAVPSAAVPQPLKGSDLQRLVVVIPSSNPRPHSVAEKPTGPKKVQSQKQMKKMVHFPA
ncbi:uncharacterized protein EI90DRAFT_857009 [Cantharellus anzutake]|uniref:uncharacterized protein n=1 Tax=Cantharellus anzutake TaxID=1750568 RepID=UPI0019042F90|nr:uncharacterized protein EI90DRAFT_857009 [Cantharellus anzutake]KAF8332416.1 hypothetical protein EI90DRAFT_857009 [Cantharellus anzutake]